MRERELEQGDGHAAWLEKQKSGGLEQEEVGQKRLELGMVSSESNLGGEKKVC